MKYILFTLFSFLTHTAAFSHEIAENFQNTTNPIRYDQSGALLVCTYHPRFRTSCKDHEYVTPKALLKKAIPNATFSGIQFHPRNYHSESSITIYYNLPKQ